MLMHDKDLLPYQDICCLDVNGLKMYKKACSLSICCYNIHLEEASYQSTPFVKWKKKASKEKAEKVKKKNSKWFFRVETKHIPKQSRITFLNHVEMCAFFKNGTLKSRINIKMITEDVLKRISPFQKKRKAMKEKLHLLHL